MSSNMSELMAKLCVYRLHESGPMRVGLTLSLELKLQSSKILAGAAAAALTVFIAPLAAQAGVSFISYGTALPTGESLITDFSSSAGLTGGNLVMGSAGGVTAAPAYSATTFDAGQYLSVPGGGSATLTFAPTKELSIYVGSLDSYNTLTFGGLGGVSYSGSAMGAISGADNGDQTGPNTNGRLVFTFASPVNSATFQSSANAFEVASVAGVVPEPATWAMMLIGIAGMGATIRGSRRRVMAAI